MKIIKDVLPMMLANGLLKVFEEGHYYHIDQSEENQYHPGEKYSCSFHRSKNTEKHPRFLEAGKILTEYVKDLGSVAKMYAYKMTPGDHFRVHDDESNGIGFIYYLCDWKWDYGGILHVEKEGRMYPILHKFNQMVVLDKGMPHFVSALAPYAKTRYALVGFVR